MATTADFRTECTDIDEHCDCGISHVKPGKGPALYALNSANVSTGRILRKRGLGVKVEEAYRAPPHQYLYKEEMGLAFMHPETFEQIHIPADSIEGVKYF